MFHKICALGLGPVTMRVGARVGRSDQCYPLWAGVPISEAAQVPQTGARMRARFAFSVVDPATAPFQ